ncbi:MAG: hypothetical protein A3A51_04510 [Candidatus Levybacteria bacterium RIFCSPLOWO2_01_FULL_39_10]|nr:MAG: hypothetical protein A3A51_04510 [Candidatus Levybacteria bacterium RIFCSPLOWO2_01_FULL_39_10]
MKILMIDDDQAVLTLFSTALKKHGYDIVTAPDGKSGIEKAKTEKPDMILLDQVLPDIQGNEVLTTLKQDDATKSIPVAMLSNFGQTELVQKAINSGATDYILKYQIEPDELDTKIRDIVRIAQSQAGSEQPF